MVESRRGQLERRMVRRLEPVERSEVAEMLKFCAEDISVVHRGPLLD